MAASNPYDAVAQKKLIFTITAGRTGTRYLAELLAHIPGITAYHEPEPNFAWVMRAAQSNPEIAYHFLDTRKILAIAMAPHAVYVETSHLFCKGFFEPMVRRGLRPRLVMLRRPPREIALSYLQRETVPARTTLGQIYLLDPRDPNVLPLPRWEALSDYQLCFWYALAIEARQISYAAFARELGIPMFDATNRELNEFATFSRLLEALGLPGGNAARAAHAEISANPHNQGPPPAHQPADLAAEERVVWDRVGHYQPLLESAVARRYGAAGVRAA